MNIEYTHVCVSVCACALRRSRLTGNPLKVDTLYNPKPTYGVVTLAFTSASICPLVYCITLRTYACVCVWVEWWCEGILIQPGLSCRVDQLFGAL